MTGKRYLGNIITNNPTNPAGPFQDGVASGIWSVSEAETFKRAGLWPTAGNTNPDVFVENVFSTFLYTGNGSANSGDSQTITNGIDLSGDGGLVWIKSRATRSHALYDTERGNNSGIYSDSSNAENAAGFGLSKFLDFNSNGFAPNNANNLNYSGENYCSWTFKKASKFFDVVTYTGNDSNRTISHNLGAVPGMILIKDLTQTGNDWIVYHRSLANTKFLYLNYTYAESTDAAAFNSTTATSTEFSLGNKAQVNTNGNSYVAYLFGHDTSSDGMIQCGYYTGDGGAGTTTVDLGFEPQWILVKASSAADNWYIIDNMRGWATHDNTANDEYLYANENNAEATAGVLDITSTGFKTTLYSNANVNGRTYIYMAIRRGPMATPTAASSVFDIKISTNTSPAFTSDNIIDTAMFARTVSSDNRFWSFRLGHRGYLYSNATNAEATGQAAWDFGDSQFGHFFSGGLGTNYMGYFWRRAPGYHDVVAYTGDGTGTRTMAHNLGVVPEMMWLKKRSTTSPWYVYHKDLSDPNNGYIELDKDAVRSGSSGVWGTGPTSTNFQAVLNTSSQTHVVYLFATLAGVSKVGSVSHSGSSTDVDCGFSSGASLVMLKRTDSTGDWYWWDSTSGIVSGNDPYFLLNTQDAQVTNTDFIDPLSSGFTITDDFTDGDYIFYAIAT